MSVSTMLLLFYIYAFLGWVCETTFVSVGKRKFVNRGFLYGPLCPVYGIGALLAVYLHSWVPNPVLFFVLSVLLLSVLEYVTGYLLEKLFRVRLWDYSNRRFQLHGRVCLRNALLFGVMSLGVCYWVQPLLLRVLGHFALGTLRSVLGLLLLVSVVDLVVTLLSLASVRGKITTVVEALRLRYPQASPEQMRQTITLRLAELRTAGGQEWQSLQERLRRRSGALGRIMDAYPHMRTQTDGAMEALRQAMPMARSKDQQVILSRVQVRPRIRYNDQGQPLFGQSASFARYFFVFFCGCVLGYFVEEIFCLLQNGHFESRQGLLYGPLNQVYGLGLVLMIAFLDAIPFRSNVMIFLICAVVGGAFEFLCSYLQEQFFGSVSWDYTGTFLSVDGRTNALFMAFWGLGGVMVYRFVMPWLYWLVESIPPRAGKRITLVLALLLGADIILTLGAMFRYADRLQGLSAQTSWDAFMDRHYPNSLMRQTFPNMKF